MEIVLEVLGFIAVQTYYWHGQGESWGDALGISALGFLMIGLMAGLPYLCQRISK